jgi:Flp pilus assembly protein TadG
MIARLFRWVRTEAGSSAVEFALLLFPVTLLIFGIIHVSLLMYTIQQLNFATEATARCMVTSQASGYSSSTCYSTTNATNYFKVLYRGVTSTPTLSTLDWTQTCNSANNYQVVATANYKIRAVLVRWDVPLEAKACFPHA